MDRIEFVGPIKILASFDQTNQYGTIRVSARHKPLWAEPCQAKRVWWHQRPCQTLGADLAPLLAACPSLASLDLSHFCCWTEDLIPALKNHPAAAASLARLDLLSASSAEGFHVSELAAIAAACPNLRHFLAPCVFNPRYLDFVGDASLLALAAACPHLSLLHLIDPSTLSPARPIPDPANDVLARNDSGITAAGLESLFAAPPPPPPSHGSTSSPPPPPRASTPPSSPLSPPLAPTLYHFLGPCVFNPRYLDFVGDASLLTLAAACPRLSLLHLVDPSTLSPARPVPDPANDVLARNDSEITAAGLESLFSALPDLEDLALDLCHNVRDAGQARPTAGRGRHGHPKTDHEPCRTRI